MKKYVLTGGPGIGKTTLIELLSAKGYAILPECARMVIEEEKIKGSDNLPWKDLASFQRLVAERQFAYEEKAFNEGHEHIFLDRSLIDGKAYSLYGNSPHVRIIDEVASGRYDKIFILDRIPEYKNDSERVEDEKFAKEIHDLIRTTYENFGYTPITVPVLPPLERLEYILRNI